MINMKKTLTGISALLLLCAGTVSASQVLVLGNSSMPFNDNKQGKNTGVCVEILEAISSHGGPEFKFELGLPWKRAQQILHDAAGKNQAIAIIPFTRTKQREDSHMWITKLVTHEVRLTTNKKAKIPEKFADAKDSTVGIIVGSALIPKLKEMGFTQIDEARTGKQNARKLEGERIDFMVESSVVAKYNWASIGQKSQDLFVGPQLGKTNEIYLAGNLDFPPKVAAEIEAAMDIIKENGKLQEILNKWN